MTEELREWLEESLLLDEAFDRLSGALEAIDCTVAWQRGRFLVVCTNDAAREQALAALGPLVGGKDWVGPKVDVEVEAP